MKNRVRYILGNGWRMLSSPWRQWDIDIDEATTLFACSFGHDGWHPLVETLKQYRETPSIGWKETALYRYHVGFCPRTTSDLVDGFPNTCDIPLFTFPWGAFRIGSQGNKDVLSSRFCGPSTEKLIESEFNAIVALYEKIRIEGYRPWSYGHGFIGGTFLHTEDGRRRFVVLQGNHRMAVLSALGVERVAVRIHAGYLAHVRESDLENWIHVRDGRCNLELARSIFRMYFNENGEHVHRMVEDLRPLYLKGEIHS